MIHDWWSSSSLIQAPMFSWPRLRDADPVLKCEMASTGEVGEQTVLLSLIWWCRNCGSVQATFWKSARPTQSTYSSLKGQVSTCLRSPLVVSFFLVCEDLGRMFDSSFPTCTFLVLFLFLVEISSRTLIPLFRPGSVHSGSASWDDCDQMFPDELRVSSFPGRFPHYAWIAA